MGRAGSDHVPHPFKSWMESAHLSYEEVAALLRVAGSETSAAYVRHIANGYRRPSYDFAKRLSLVTKGAVSVSQFMEFRRDRPEAA